MTSGATVGTHGPPTADECRRFFLSRGDVSLGLVPQLLLDEKDADTWAFFWYAARTVDDDVENGRASGDALAQRLRSGARETVAEQALGLALLRLPDDAARSALMTDLEVALKALDRERAFKTPPALAAYAAVSIDKAVPPLRFFHKLLFSRQHEDHVERFTRLLALSIQVGDDVRDRSRDVERGVLTWSAEELEAGQTESPTDPEAPVRKWREAASHWLCLMALERAERFSHPEQRQRARLEAGLWMRTIESGQLNESQHPLRWPEPLGDLVGGGYPSSARMAAARRVLRGESKLLGDPRKWDASYRAQEIQRLKQSLPVLYQALDAAARSP